MGGPTDIQQAAACDQTFQSQLQALLGDAGFARLQEFNEERPGQMVVKSLDDQLGDNGLNEDQSGRLVQLAKALPLALPLPLAGQGGEATFGSQQDLPIMCSREWRAASASWIRLPPSSRRHNCPPSRT